MFSISLKSLILFVLHFMVMASSMVDDYLKYHL